VKDKTKNDVFKKNKTSFNKKMGLNLPPC
jgi:hypothetical protein